MITRIVDLLPQKTFSERTIHQIHDNRFLIVDTRKNGSSIVTSIKCSECEEKDSNLRVCLNSGYKETILSKSFFITENAIKKAHVMIMKEISKYENAAKEFYKTA